MTARCKLSDSCVHVLLNTVNIQEEFEGGKFIQIVVFLRLIKPILRWNTFPYENPEA